MEIIEANIIEADNDLRLLEEVGKHEEQEGKRLLVNGILKRGEAYSKYIAKGNSQVQAGKFFGCDRATISNYLRGANSVRTLNETEREKLNEMGSLRAILRVINPPLDKEEITPLQKTYIENPPTPESENEGNYRRVDEIRKRGSYMLVDAVENLEVTPSTAHKIMMQYDMQKLPKKGKMDGMNSAMSAMGVYGDMYWIFGEVPSELLELVDKKRVTKKWLKEQWVFFSDDSRNYGKGKRVTEKIKQNLADMEGADAQTAHVQSKKEYVETEKTGRVKIYCYPNQLKKTWEALNKEFGDDYMDRLIASYKGAGND